MPPWQEFMYNKNTSCWFIYVAYYILYRDVWARAKTALDLAERSGLPDPLDLAVGLYRPWSAPVSHPLIND